MIDAGLADEPLGTLLGIAPGAPVLRIERLTHDAHHGWRRSRELTG